MIQRTTRHKTFPWPLLWLMLLFGVPLVMATLLYGFHPRLTFKLIPHGQLLSPAIPATTLGIPPIQAAQGKWQLVTQCLAANQSACAEQYDLLQRIHLALGKDQHRVWLADPSFENLSPTLDNNQVLLIDPRGFVILRYALPLPKPKGMLEDIRRLLRFSHVG